MTFNYVTDLDLMTMSINKHLRRSSALVKGLSALFLFRCKAQRCYTPIIEDRLHRLDYFILHFGCILSHLFINKIY